MSAAKSTSPGWPDPSDWVNRLYQSMAARQAEYDAEPDALLKRTLAGLMLKDVVSSLMELPKFKNVEELLALKELLRMLADLNNGRAHPWSIPSPTGGTSSTTTATGELKLVVRAAYALLLENGYRPVEAHKRIAAGLTKSGRSARKRGPYSPQTIKKWCLQDESPSDDHVRNSYKRHWEQARPVIIADSQARIGGSPLAEKEIVGRFVDGYWMARHLPDRFISLR